MSCPGCGFASGHEQCRALFEQSVARDFNDVRYGRWHRMAVDAYALQHPDDHCVSAKSLLAHLGGLCCALEHGNDANLIAALSRSLNGRIATEKPALPPKRGAMILADVMAAPDPASYGLNVERWARHVWDAYSPLHPFARQWIAALRA